MSIFLLFCFTFSVTLSASFTDAFPKSGKNTIQHGVVTVRNGRDTIGVSSMARATSNNGKVSSVGGVKFFHPPGMSISKDGDTMRFKYPLEGNGMATGFVHMGPGSVIASSSTYNVPHNMEPAIKIPPSDYMTNWPTFNDYIFQPQIDLYQPPNYLDPWFNHAIDFTIPKPYFRNGWPYTNLDPFQNLWR